MASFPIHPNEKAKKARRRPHQGARECARRSGNWKLVSIIDALKRYPYGINHRLPSMLRPDRTELPEPSRIITLGR